MARVLSRYWQYLRSKIPVPRMPFVGLINDVIEQYFSSDPSGPVNSCIFVAVLYFPVFRLCPVFSCI